MAGMYHTGYQNSLYDLFVEYNLCDEENKEIYYSFLNNWKDCINFFRLELIKCL